MRTIGRGLAAVSVTDVVMVTSLEDGARYVVASARPLDGHAVSYEEALEALGVVRRSVSGGPQGDGRSSMAQRNPLMTRR